jgi:hypothetical protein
MTTPNCNSDLAKKLKPEGSARDNTFVCARDIPRRAGATVLASATLAVAMLAAPARADDTAGTNQVAAPESCPVVDYFTHWFDRVNEIQAEQPHWVTPLVTVTPRLEEELRYDQFHETVPGGNSLDVYGGGKGVELIPLRPVEVIIGVPAWETENTSPRKSGWADETFLLKYRLLSANAENGDYILTAFFGLSVPSGSDDFSAHHYGFTPTIAFGKGFGRFDIQSTVGVSFPDNGATASGPGTPILYNTALQYHVEKYLWPEVEFNYTYWPNGEHKYKNQLFVTPGLALGRIPVWHRVGVTLVAGYQVAVSDKPLTRNNFILSARIPF